MAALGLSTRCVTLYGARCTSVSLYCAVCTSVAVLFAPSSAKGPWVRDGCDSVLLTTALNHVSSTVCTYVSIHLQATKEGNDVAIKIMKIPGGYSSDVRAICRSILFLAC
jgi:membrane-bound ClpP family serine protease